MRWHLVREGRSGERFSATATKENKSHAKAQRLRQNEPQINADARRSRTVKSERSPITSPFSWNKPETPSRAARYANGQHYPGVFSLNRGSARLRRGHRTSAQQRLDTNSLY